jgi:hypothetical protein
VDTFPDGGRDYVYDTDGDGVGETHSPVPPEGFDRTTATDEQLRQYGIPPRPTDPQDLARWRDTVGRVHETVHSDLALIPCITFR